MFDRYIRHTHTQTHTNTKASQQFFFIGSILIGEEQKLDSIHYIMCIQVENLKLHGNSGKKEIFREGCLSWHGYFFFALFCCVYDSVCVRFSKCVHVNTGKRRFDRPCVGVLNNIANWYLRGE